MHRHLLALALMPLLAACGDTSNPTTTTPDTAAQAIAEASGAAATGSATTLQPGQRLQGLIEADAGNGMQAFRSLSTTVADDIGQQVESGLASGTGKRALSDANRRLAQSGVPTRVDADDVRGLVGSMAGKTFHDSSILHVGMTGSLNVGLNGTADDGAKLSVDLRFDDTSGQFQDASLSYQPVGKSAFNRYQTTKQAPVQVTIERFEKNADGSYALAGSFRADAVPAGRMAKALAGTTLASVHGRFAFDALPAKKLNIGG